MDNQHKQERPRSEGGQRRYRQTPKRKRYTLVLDETLYAFARAEFGNVSAGVRFLLEREREDLEREGTST